MEANTSLLERGIRIWVGRFTKHKKHHGRQLGQALALDPAFRSIKVLLLLDGELDIQHLGDIFWRFAANTDPRRDMQLITDAEGLPHLVIDASQKSAELDDFRRPWPNPTVMDADTIALVDQKWASYELGPFVPSPSQRYLALMCGTTAIASANS